MMLRGHDDPFCSTSEINDGRARRLRCVRRHHRFGHRLRCVRRHRRFGHRLRCGSGRPLRSNDLRRGPDGLSSLGGVTCCCGSGGGDGFRSDGRGGRGIDFDPS